MASPPPGSWPAAATATREPRRQRGRALSPIAGDGAGRPAGAAHRGEPRDRKAVIDYFDEMAAAAHELWSGGGLCAASAEKIIELLGIKCGSSVLDLCCGSGILTGKIREAVGGGGLVVGVDASAEMLKIAGRSRAALLVNGDAENFALDMAFDAITCQYGLAYLDWRAAFCGIKRHLKRGGAAGIVLHGRRGPERALHDAANGTGGRGAPAPDLESAIRRCGLRVKTCGYHELGGGPGGFGSRPGAGGGGQERPAGPRDGADQGSAAGYGAGDPGRGGDLAPTERPLFVVEHAREAVGGQE